MAEASVSPESRARKRQLRAGLKKKNLIGYIVRGGQVVSAALIKGTGPKVLMPLAQKPGLVAHLQAWAAA
jgi:hypothetical protein